MSFTSDCIQRDVAGWGLDLGHALGQIAAGLAQLLICLFQLLLSPIYFVCLLYVALFG